MVCLTKKTCYALIAMAYMAHRGGELSSAREIAERFDIPVSLLMNVLKELASAGYVESVRGARGGYRLARGTDEIAVGEMVEALEGPIRASHCLRDRIPDDQQCERTETCEIADPVHRLHRMMHDFLHGIALGDIMELGELAEPHVATEPARPRNASDVRESADLP